MNEPRNNEKERSPIQLGELRRGDVVGMDLADGTKGTATIKSVQCFSDPAIDAVMERGSHTDFVKIAYIEDGTGEKRSCIASSEDEIYVIKEKLG